MKRIFIKLNPQETRHASVPIDQGGPLIPSGMWDKCSKCSKLIYIEDLKEQMKVCPQCGHHFRLTARERIEYTVDEQSFEEMFSNLEAGNPLSFPGYENKITTSRASTGLDEAVICGTGLMGGIKVALAVMDGFFIMGSMGSAVGEKITRTIEYATEHRLPLVIFTVSGGARMQEGLISLMQMAKVSGALSKHNQAGLLYITVITDPTTGGVTASFAMLGDIILSEPKAVIGFAGRRVIEQTSRQILPEGFQTAEFMLEKGFIDAIVSRGDMRDTLINLISLHKEEV